MLAPLSWLKEYVDTKLSPRELGDRLTEVGLSTEKIIKDKDDIIFEFEITPNRPDLLSILGIAQEIAAIEGKSIKHFKGVNINLSLKKILPLKIQTDPKINPRFTGIIIDGITVRESPKWLKERLIKIGQRPINNIVDITNYVMLELGNPIHAFDYDKIKGAVMKVHQTKGGEKFTSVDGISYRLPKNAVVISDNEEIIDLCGIKGGENTGTYEKTKTIFIRVPVEVPSLIRRASLSLGLRSEASSIFERGVNAGGTLNALQRCVNLVLEIAGGKIASNIYDIKKEEFNPWRLDLSLEKLKNVLGISIAESKILKILENLNLSPEKISKGTIRTEIPTYRNDLKAEEDLIEEVARIYGYNNFPKTIPSGQTPVKPPPYYRDYRLEEKVKNIFKEAGFSEIYTYSLISEKDLTDNEMDPDKTLRVDNPVSREFEYLRPTLMINLKKAVALNKPNFEDINLFELGKVYRGANLDKKEESYFLSGISTKMNFVKVKGVIERLFEELGIKEDPSQYVEAIEEGIFFELNYDEFSEKINLNKTFKPIPKYPPIKEDLALMMADKIKTGDIIREIKDQSPLIREVSLLEKFQNIRTFHIVYQNPRRNLTSGEVEKIRERILVRLKTKLKIKPKD